MAHPQFHRRGPDPAWVLAGVLALILAGLIVLWILPDPGEPRGNDPAWRHADGEP